MRVIRGIVGFRICFLPPWIRNTKDLRASKKRSPNSNNSNSCPKRPQEPEPFDFFADSTQVVGIVRCRIAQFVVVALLALSVGGHWIFLQSVAWAGMFARFSKDCSVPEALEKTFDGKHPCKLCVVVQEGKKTEQKQKSVKVETKLDHFVLERRAAWSRSFSVCSTSWRDRNEFMPERGQRPPTPPPRFA